jgi:superoxide dismutase, Cu-Zn family
MGVRVIAMVAAVAVLGGCGAKEQRPAAGPAVVEERPGAQDVTSDAATAGAARAVARLRGAPGSGIDGQVVLVEATDGQIVVEAEVRGLDRAGPHGFHVHEHGRCDAPDFESAGDHFDPTDGLPHAGPRDPLRHAGDLGNVVADERGEGALVLVVEEISLGEDERSVIGRSVILHAEPDDLVTQPTGDAGARIACGVIERVE